MALKSVPASAAADKAWELQLSTNQHGQVRPSVSNLIAILVNDSRWQGVLAWNDLASRPEALLAPPWHEWDAPTGGAKAGPLEDADSVRVRSWLERSWSLTAAPAKETVEAALQVACFRRRFHPVQDYLRALRWDGTRRLDHWLSTYAGVADTEYAQLVGRWWMLQAVARAFEPGVLAKYVLVLEGAQDLKKSSLCRTLASPWYSDTQIRDPGDKESLIGLRGVWIIELAEVDSLTRGEAHRLKAFISQLTDKYRQPWGVQATEHPRPSVFIATINPGGVGYFQDPTGAVRWWPVACTAIDLAALARDRDQLWAEAVAYYQEGAPRWPETPHERALCEEQQEQRYQGDAREEAIALWLQTSAGKAALAADDLTSLRLLESALGLKGPDLRDRAAQIAVGVAMHRLGYSRAQRRQAGARVWVYRPMVTPASDERRE